MNCGYIIEDLCKKNNITKKEFAIKTGINETNFTYWKKGRTPNGDILAKIANFFNVSTDYLLGRENTNMGQNSPNDEMKNIGNKIEELCKEKNITQKELSKNIEISENTIITWKKGSYPRSDILAKIADFFNVSTDYLLGRENASKGANSLNYEEFGITNISLIEKRANL